MGQAQTQELKCAWRANFQQQQQQQQQQFVQHELGTP